MASTDAIPVPRKNTAYRFYFAIRKPSDSTLITTWTGADSEVSLDGASYSDCTNEATEIGTTGTGYIDLTSGEMNADCVILKITVTNTGAVPLVFALYPETAGDYRIADVPQITNSTLTGTCIATGATTTNIPFSAITPTLTVTDQVKGRVIIFDADTATAALRGQGGPIDGSTTSAITLAVGDALTTAPTTGDTFTIY